MDSSDGSARTRRAIGLSIVAHVCGLWILALLLGYRLTLDANEPNDDAIATVTSLVRRAPERRARPAAAATTVVVLRPVADASKTAPPVARVTVHVPLGSKAPTVRSASKRSPILRSAPARVVIGPHARRLALLPQARPSIVAPVMVAVAPTPTPLPSRTPTPLPSRTPAPPPSPTTTPAAAAGANFGGLFSQNYPPAFAAPDDLAALRSRLHEHGRIRVDVDETGRATDVRFVAPIADETLAADIRSMLLGLHYVPADCNGLHCDGTLEINY